jgi:tetratricopeptide (TPR) repeat protein
VSTALTANTGDGGVHAVGALVNFQLGWAFRPQPVRDVGIDAQVEPVLAGKETGRLLGLQIKAGAHWFARPTPDSDGWVFTEDTQTHRDYWLRYRLPVLLVLYNPDTNTAYWQHVTKQTAIVTGKGFKVVVPETQRLDATAGPLLAALAQRPPADGLSELLDELPGSCAGRLRMLDDHDPVLARRMAAALHAGRDDPAATVDRVIGKADPSWGWLAWAALGEYANEYDVAERAADCFLRAEAAGANGEPGRWRAFAGLVLSAVDAGRARPVLTEAAELSGGRLLAAIGLATLDHATRNGPVPVPTAVIAAADHVDRDPTIQRFLAEQRRRAGDLAAALAHHEKALSLVPEAVGQQLAVAELLLRREGNAASALRMADYRRAANLASVARAARRRWLANSLRAAELLMQALSLAGDDEAAMRVATEAPDGDATPQEAACPALAFPAARTAYERGDIDRGDRFAAVVEASGDPAWTSQLDAIRAEHQGLDRDEREKRWRAVVAAPVSDGQRLWALSQLASLGCWPLPELDGMNAAGMLAPGMYDLLHARALSAIEQHQDALVLLRANVRASLLVAEEYARLLAKLDRVDECIAACDQAANRFGETRLDLYALDVLTHAGRIDEVLTRGATFLARADLPFNLRQFVRAKLIDEYGQRRDWAGCERLAAAGLAECVRLDEDLRVGRVDAMTLPATAPSQLLEYRTRYVWGLVIYQFNQGDVERAIDTMQTHQPPVGTAVEAGVWTDLNQLRGWTADTAQEGLRIAQRPDTPPALVGRILFSLLQAIPPPGQPTASGHADRAGTAQPADASLVHLPVDFHEQLRATWRSYVEVQPQRFHALSSDDDELVAQLRAMVRPGATREAIAHEAIWRGQAPLGAASTAAEAPYLLSLARRRTRILPAVDARDAIHQEERHAAAAALGQCVSVETSALYLAAAVVGAWRNVSVEFSGLLLAELSARDILASHAAARAMTNVTGHLGLNLHTGQLQVSDLTDEDRTTIVEHTAAVHAAAQDCQITPIADLASIGSRHPVELVGAWLAPIAVAVEQSVPLYSDDAYLRAMARARGVTAFGTLALLDVLAGERDLAMSPEDILRALFDHHVVDLPQVPELILTAPHDGQPVSDAVLLNLARPAMWQRDHDNEAGLIATIAERAHRHSPAMLAEITTAITTGYAAAFDDTEGALAMCATIILAYVTGVTEQAARVVVPAVRAVGASYGVDPTTRLRGFLLGVLTDADDRFRLSPDEATRTVHNALNLL